MLATGYRLAINRVFHLAHNSTVDRILADRGPAVDRQRSCACHPSGDGGQYRLDPEDGRFNSEFIVFLMTEGKVTSFYYSPD
jgi:hypothetical protein